MQFGDPVMTMIPTTIVPPTTPPAMAIYLSADSERCLVWRKRLYVVPVTQVKPWRCPQCRGARVWWSLRHLPTCVTCSPMPIDTYDKAWTDATAAIETLAKGKDAVEAARIRTQLDDAVQSGDLSELLKLCLSPHLLALREQLARQERAQEKGEHP